MFTLSVINIVWLPVGYTSQINVHNIYLPIHINVLDLEKCLIR